MDYKLLQNVYGEIVPSIYMARCWGNFDQICEMLRHRDPGSYAKNI